MGHVEISKCCKERPDEKRGGCQLLDGVCGGEVVSSCESGNTRLSVDVTSSSLPRESLEQEAQEIRVLMTAVIDVRRVE